MTTGPSTPASALSGLRVIELGESVAPAFAGRWLAAFGAEVTKVELPGGSWLRRYSPTRGDGGQEPGPLATFLDAGKTRMLLDPGKPEDRATLLTSIRGADVFIHDLAPDALARAGLAAGALRPANPDLTEVALTPFGSDGPYANYAASSIVLLALGGYQFLTGEPGREPLMLPGFQPEYLTGFYGAISALSGVLARAAGGGGRRFEITMMEALASLHQFTTSQWLYGGSIRSRHGNRWENLYPITMLPCHNGYLALSMPAPDQWERLCLMIERPDLLSDPRFATPVSRRAQADAIDAVLLDWLRTRDMDEVFVAAQEQWRLPVNPYRDLTEVLRDPQYLSRGFWVHSEDDPAGPLHPGIPAIMSGTGWAVRGTKGGREPAVGSQPRVPPPPSRLAGTGPHEGGETKARDSKQVPVSPRRLPTPDSRLPLSGVVVLDFTRVWSGPLCTRILADLGARVIKIEPPFPRNAAPGPAALGMGGGRPTAGLGKLNRNKLSVGIDLRRPGGQWLLQRLAARADLLVENFSARVMPNFGLGYETLRQDNPGLIYLSMTGYGTFGPYREYLGYGSATEAMTGLTALIGYPGEEPLNSAIAYPDAVAGLTGASCALTALVQRAHTGQGQFIDLSQLEPSSLVLGEFFLAAQLDGHAPPRTGNHHPIWAPHGTYRCRGGDEWVSLAVRSDAEWAAFCRVAGLEALGQDSGLADAAGRRAQRERINAAISAWTRDQDKFAVMERLQRAGIPAGAVLNAKELVENPYLAHRGFFVDARAPEGGSFPMPGTPITVDGGKRDEWHAAPLRGEHNALVLTELLGMESREIDALTAAGVLVDGTPVGA